MARTTKITRVVGNRGRAFGSPSKQKKSYKRNPHRRNSGGEIVAFSLAGNPGRKVKAMAKSKRKRYNRPGSKSHVRRNTGRKNHAKRSNHRRRSTRRRNPGMAMRRHNYHRRNPGTGSIGEVITTSTFVLVGALGSKLGAQLVLGTNNTGVIGYAGNLAVGGVLWFLADKVMKNKTAASGVIAGTVAQLILRLINDYTPFGTYISGLGMGDYQMQSFVTPQILVDPLTNADISIPPGWAPKMISAAPAASGSMGTPAGKAAATKSGVSGMYGGGRMKGMYS